MALQEATEVTGRTQACLLSQAKAVCIVGRLPPHTSGFPGVGGHAGLASSRDVRCLCTAGSTHGKSHLEVIV